MAIPAYAREWARETLTTPEQQAEVRAEKRAYFRHRWATDIQFRIAVTARGRFNSALKGRTKVGSAVRDLGCSIAEFKVYVEHQFTNGMTWDNRGALWHLDHIVAIDLADLTVRDEFLLVFNWENHQPLLGPENLKKSNKPPRPGQRGWERYQQLLVLQGQATYLDAVK